MTQHTTDFGLQFLMKSKTRTSHIQGYLIIPFGGPNVPTIAHVEEKANAILGKMAGDDWTFDIVGIAKNAECACGGH